MSKSVVLITGALTGIGRATALAFARDDADLVVSGRHEDAGQALADELRGLGVEAAFVRADVRHEDDVRNLVEQAVARFGRLDVAVNNAGTEGKPGPVTDQTVEDYAATFDTNVLGTLLSMKHELRVMQAQGRGSIVNISSTMGERGAANLSLYTGSKHAVELRTRFLGSADTDVDVFRRDFPSATRGVIAQIRELHLRVLSMESGDSGIDGDSLAHSCTACFALSAASNRWK